MGEVIWAIRNHEANPRPCTPGSTLLIQIAPLELPTKGEKKASKNLIITYRGGVFNNPTNIPLQLLKLVPRNKP
jgi:hypothetical protein